MTQCVLLPTSYRNGEELSIDITAKDYYNRNEHYFNGVIMINKKMYELGNKGSDIRELFEDGKRNWAKTKGKKFSICRLVHLNTIANFKTFRDRIRKWKKNNK